MLNWVGRQWTELTVYPILSHIFSYLMDVIGQSFTGVWRRDRDSNPGHLSVNTLSRRAP